MNDDRSFLFFIICWWVFEVWIVYLLYKASVKLGIFEPLETLKTINPAMAFLEALVIAMVSLLFGYLGPLIMGICDQSDKIEEILKELKEAEER